MQVSDQLGEALERQARRGMEKYADDYVAGEENGQALVLGAAEVFVHASSLFKNSEPLTGTAIKWLEYERDDVAEWIDAIEQDEAGCTPEPELAPQLLAHRAIVKALEVVDAA